MLQQRLASKLAIATLLLLASLFAAEDQSAISQFDSLIEARKYAEVTGPLQTYIAAHPDSWRALYQLGYVDFRLHDIHRSLVLLSKSLALNGNFADSHKILAYDLNILGRQDLAIRELTAAIRLDPTSAESHYELGRIYYERGDYLQSVHELERSKALDPASVKVYHNLGLAYSAIGQNAKAVASFEEGLVLNTKQENPSAWPLIDYGTYYNLQSDYANAKNMLLKAIAIDASWDREWDELSKANRGLGERNEAIESLKKAIAINPGKPEYHYALARLFTQAGEHQEAKKELAKYEQEKNHPQP